MSERYADQRGHDVAWMTAAEREALDVPGARHARHVAARARRAPTWQRDRLERIPGAVVVDGHDGYVFWNGSDGALFTRETAQAFADERNADMKPEHALYRVFTLTAV